MCPLWPLHWVLLYLAILCPLWFASCQMLKLASPTWMVRFSPEEVRGLEQEQERKVYFTSTDFTVDDLKGGGTVDCLVKDPTIASVYPESLVFRSDYLQGGNLTSYFNITGNFLGYTDVRLRFLPDGQKDNSSGKESQPLRVSVIRKPSMMDKVFTTSVIVLVSIVFINFGCALDIEMLKQAIIRPIGPVIGLVNHFLILPLIGYGLGLLLFPTSTALQLGLFFAAVSPAGGASNIWTVTLGGNLNLSVTMTAVSTLCSFFMIPLWVLTLGRQIFKSGHLGVPYTRIVTSAAGLFIPLVIGYLIQVYCKKFARLMVRILKPFSAFLIAFIVVFAIVTNLYLFKLFTWQIVVGGLGIPIIGYINGWVLSSLFRMPGADVLAVAVETGVQNTGIAIFLLRFCLDQPAADLTTVVPVSIAMMTPIPLLFLYVIRRCRGDLTGVKLQLPLDDAEPCVRGRDDCSSSSLGTSRESSSISVKHP